MFSLSSLSDLVESCGLQHSAWAVPEMGSAKCYKLWWRVTVWQSWEAKKLIRRWSDSWTLSRQYVKLPHSTWGSAYQDYFGILTSLTSEPSWDKFESRYVSGQSNASNRPTVRKCNVESWINQVISFTSSKKHTIAECFTCRLTRNSYQFILHHQSVMFVYRK